MTNYEPSHFEELNELDQAIFEAEEECIEEAWKAKYIARFVEHATIAAETSFEAVKATYNFFEDDPVNAANIELELNKRA